MRGTRTSPVEVLGITPHGLWLSVHGAEHFLSFKDFPWFKSSAVSSVLKVKLLHRTHLRWPDLDVDLELDAIADPTRYPLIAREAPHAIEQRKTDRKRAKTAKG